MKRNQKLAILAGILVAIWIPVMVYAHGEDLTKRGVALGGVLFFTPLMAGIVTAAIWNFHEDL